MKTSNTSFERFNALREAILRSSPEITRRIRETANERNEGRFRTVFANIIERWAEEQGIALDVCEERILANGIADATYNKLVIEYEAPGSLRDNPNHPHTEHAIEQVRRYLEGVANAEHRDIHRYAGVVTDGFFFIHLRKIDDNWLDPSIEPVNEHSVAYFLRLLVSLYSGRALIPDNLVDDFGGGTGCARQVCSTLYSSLSRAISDNEVGIVAKIFEQWKAYFGECTSFYGNAEKLRNRPQLLRFVQDMGIDLETISLPMLFFTIHSYFAVLIKLIAYYSLSGFVPAFAARYGSLYQLSDGDLQEEMDELERGGIFLTVGIKNFLEGDFFMWYLNAWDKETATAIRSILDRLKDYDPGTAEVSPEQTRDLLKKLFHRLMPKEIRHDLGEYYTPDWLASFVLNKLGYEGQVDKRLLDPACGSGTFLVQAIARLRERCSKIGMSDCETLETILHNVIGMDLSPLAVVAARTNYLLALGELVSPSADPIQIPVYLSDSVLTPTAGQHLFGQDRYEIRTVVDQFDIPISLKTHNQIDNLCSLLDECVTSEIDTDVFLARAQASLGLSSNEWGEGPESDGARLILCGLYEKLLKLHRDGLDGIWARILRNAFMPLFLGKFDFIAGNPPWINWQYLSTEYRVQVAPLWTQHELFPHHGFDAILGAGRDDLSYLMTYVVLTEFCAPDGVLGFLITQSAFKASGGGQGFRRFRLHDGTPIKVNSVEDFSSMQLFENTTNRTVAFFMQRGEQTAYPVEYGIWQKIVRGGINQSATLSDVMSRLRRLQYLAIPVDPNDDTSAWLTGRGSAITSIRHLCRPSECAPRKGITASNRSVFWIQRTGKLSGGRIAITNYTEGARELRVRQVIADIEDSLVFPLLRGRDVQRWSAEPSLEIIVTHEARSGLTAIAESEMQQHYPRTYAYLKRFKEPLKATGIFKRYFTRKQGGRTIETGPFYSMFNVGSYTFSDWKVVFREIASTLVCAVVGSQYGKPIIPDHKLVMIPAASEHEAHYLCGLLNSTVIGLLALSYSVPLQFSTHLGEYAYLPRLDPSNKLHKEIANISKKLHSAVSSGQETTELENSLDRCAASIYGISEEQLGEIQSCHRELTRADLHDHAAVEQDDEVEDEE